MKFTGRSSECFIVALAVVDIEACEAGGIMATGVPMADSDYIKRMVGDTLAKGCAATMAANPTDPVEYLGQWLLQYAL